MTALYFFGCRNNHAGHYLTLSPMMRDTPLRYFELAAVLGRHPDTEFCYGVDKLVRGEWRRTKPEIPGAAALHHVNGWTVLSWWDRSVDSRPGGNASLIAEGTFTEEEILQLGREHFGPFLERMAYKIAVPID